ncbi:protein PXR1-like [Penaeus monodon]|uniref:protein PXR1-like n=1 Tax=Penaeus monodon TaxID=6687 RepID=UPI0018A7C887|nr:protein PXR1-like [Penaeus monodon]
MAPVARPIRLNEFCTCRATSAETQHWIQLSDGHVTKTSGLGPSDRNVRPRKTQCNPKGDEDEYDSKVAESVNLQRKTKDQKGTFRKRKRKIKLLCRTISRSSRRRRKRSTTRRRRRQPTCRRKRLLKEGPSGKRKRIKLMQDKLEEKEEMKKKYDSKEAEAANLQKEIGKFKKDLQEKEKENRKVTDIRKPETTWEREPSTNIEDSPVLFCRINSRRRRRRCRKRMSRRRRRQPTCRRKSERSRRIFRKREGKTN